MPGKLYLITRTLLIVFLVEVIIMLIFAALELNLEEISEAFLDGFLLTTFSTPLLHRWVIKPFVEGRDLAVKQLQSEQQRAQNYLDTASVIMVAVDREGRVTMANRKCCEILNMNEQDLVGVDWIEHFIVDSERNEMKKLFKAIMGGTSELPQSHENLIKSSNGSIRLTTWNNNFIYDENDKIVGILSSGEDITDRRKAEEALAASKKETEHALEEMSELNLELQTEAARRKQVEEAMHKIRQIDNLTEVPALRTVKMDLNSMIDGEPDLPICIASIKLHGIREINHKYGLDRGDAAIVEASIRVKDFVDNGGIVGRTHGAGFVVAYIRCDAVEKMKEKLAELKQILQQPLETVQELKLDISINQSHYPDDFLTIDELIDKTILKT